MGNKLRRRTQLTLSTEHGDIELEFEPYNEDDVLIERVGDKLVVAYLVHDDDPGINPLKDYDCQGDLYTRSRLYGGGVITDNDSEFYGALGLDCYGNVDIDSNFPVPRYVDPRGVQHSVDNLRSMAAAKILNTVCQDVGLLEEWLDHKDYVLDPGETYDMVAVTHRAEIYGDLYDRGDFMQDAVEELAVELYPAHWQQIAGPYVVPVASSRGSYETTYSPTTWDGDVEDLPDGVWVADKGAVQNIGEGCRKGVVVKRGKETYRGPSGWLVEADGRNVAFFSDIANAVVCGMPRALKQAYDYVDQHYSDRPMDVHTAAVHYASSVLDEYSKWCSGEVFGCVTQVFVLANEPKDGEEPEWIACEDYDSCWGYIGQEYAEEILKDEFFDAAERLRKAQTQPASN